MQSVHITTNVGNSNPDRGEVYSIQHLCDKVCQWFASCLWFSPDTPVSSTNITDCHDITEILLKVTLNTINLTHNILHRLSTYMCRVIVFNATFNNISVISWRSVLFLEETRVPGGTTDKLYHIMLLIYLCALPCCDVINCTIILVVRGISSLN